MKREELEVYRCCDVWELAGQGGTDNEGYGRLRYFSARDGSTGSSDKQW